MKKSKSVQDWLSDIVRGRPVNQHVQNPDFPDEWVLKKVYPTLTERLSTARCLMQYTKKTTEDNSLEETYKSLIQKLPG
ncbi:hypothetical protein UFOVP81_19 [uncultured Caudovirales phage]|uniref:Uncharacterized protein n=1 Tax=uncultured Caudovirales phage TaxID=2100421 RepID=A0A6J5KZM6_9CAUD|nr:hypothetical protein UFOVP81_19 [uncultured Caudovirales phage]